MYSKILTLNLCDIRKKIASYQCCHDEAFPILLMNDNTLEYLKNLSKEFICIKEPITYVTLCGCKIAIAPWVQFGEVELR